MGRLPRLLAARHRLAKLSASLAHSRRQRAGRDRLGRCGRRQRQRDPRLPGRAGADVVDGHTVPAITATGKLYVANIANTDPELFAAWASKGSGGLLEYWIGRDAPLPAGRLRCGRTWDWLSSYQIDTQAAGKVFFGHATQQPGGPPTDQAQIRYERASFLVSWSGGASASFYSTGTAADPYTSDATVNVGQPIEPKQAVDGGGFVRRYTRGIAIVNRSCSGTVTFELDGAYRRPDGVLVSSAVLSGPSGMTLTRP